MTVLIGGGFGSVPSLDSFCRRSLMLTQAADPRRQGARMSADSQTPQTRIVVLGGGFGGVYTARHLERLCRGRRDVEIVLVSRDNFLLMTPLLFEVCSGTLDLRHCAF